MPVSILFIYSLYHANYSSVFSHQSKIDSPVYSKHLYPVIHIILITTELTMLKELQYNLHCVGLNFCNWYITQPVCIIHLCRPVYYKEDLLSGIVHTGVEVRRMDLEMSRLMEQSWL